MMKRIVALTVLCFAGVFALGLAPISGLFAAVPGHIYQVTVKSSFGTTFTDCFRFDTPQPGFLTIEGLGSPDALHPLQAAFIERDAFQCGYCTPGQICSAVGMLAEADAGWPSHVTADVALEQVELTEVEIRERMSGNICRCAAYPNSIAAIRDVLEGTE